MADDQGYAVEYGRGGFFGGVGGPKEPLKGRQLYTALSKLVEPVEPDHCRGHMKVGMKSDKDLRAWWLVVEGMLEYKEIDPRWTLHRGWWTLAELRRAILTKEQLGTVTLKVTPDPKVKATVPKPATTTCATAVAAPCVTAPDSESTVTTTAISPQEVASNVPSGDRQRRRSVDLNKKCEECGQLGSAHADTVHWITCCSCGLHYTDACLTKNGKEPVKRNYRCTRCCVHQKKLEKMTTEWEDLRIDIRNIAKRVVTIEETVLEIKNAPKQILPEPTTGSYNTDKNLMVAEGKLLRMATEIEKVRRECWVLKEEQESEREKIKKKEAEVKEARVATQNEREVSLGLKRQLEKKDEELHRLQSMLPRQPPPPWQSDGRQAVQVPVGEPDIWPPGVAFPTREEPVWPRVELGPTARVQQPEPMPLWSNTDLDARPRVEPDRARPSDWDKNEEQKKLEQEEENRKEILQREEEEKRKAEEEELQKRVLLVQEELQSVHKQRQWLKKGHGEIEDGELGRRRDKVPFEWTTLRDSSYDLYGKNATETGNEVDEENITQDGIPDDRKRKAALDGLPVPLSKRITRKKEILFVGDTLIQALCNDDGLEVTAMERGWDASFKRFGSAYDVLELLKEEENEVGNYKWVVICGGSHTINSLSYSNLEDLDRQLAKFVVQPLHEAVKLVLRKGSKPVVLIPPPRKDVEEWVRCRAVSKIDSEILKEGGCTFYMDLEDETAGEYIQRLRDGINFTIGHFRSVLVRLLDFLGENPELRQPEMKFELSEYFPGVCLGCGGPFTRRNKGRTEHSHQKHPPCNICDSLHHSSTICVFLLKMCHKCGKRGHKASKCHAR